MKVGQIVAPRQIEIVDIEQPNLADYPDGTVMIKTVHSAICGTDMPSFVLEHPAESYPLGPGLSIHEAIGIVTESTSDKFKAGDEVLALPRYVGGLSEYFLSDESVTLPLTDFPRKDCILMSQPLGNGCLGMPETAEPPESRHRRYRTGTDGAPLYTHAEQSWREDSDNDRSGRFPTRSFQEDACDTHD